MKYLFLNKDACSGRAHAKWSELRSSLVDLSEMQVIENFAEFDWSALTLKSGDVFISAGGDGTLHCMVNGLIKHKGLSSLMDIKIGHIGLGSNNSFLRPYEECQVLKNIPMKISTETFQQDLMQIEVSHNGKTETYYCVANASMGFLAEANKLFNSSKDIAVIKRWNSDLADVYTFLKALTMWTPASISTVIEGQSWQKEITNVHFMKRPFYASDLGFPETISATSGNFHLNVLWQKSSPIILKKFIQMMVFKRFEEGRDHFSIVSEATIQCQKAIPIEMDGEIYYGTNFKIKTIKAGINLCK